MPKLALKSGGAISISESTDYPSTLTVEGAAGTPVTVELADLPEVEKLVQLVEDPDGFEKQHGG